ncbi:hypothetical protein, partial [Vibrio metoecus]|uniref:hypothetical protein n=1 Tax=Vibrio metoecus TaxID=1481663 RepID=UPI001C3EC6D6
MSKTNNYVIGKSRDSSQGISLTIRIDINHPSQLTMKVRKLTIKKISSGIAGGFSYAPIRLSYKQHPNRRIT